MTDHHATIAGAAAFAGLTRGPFRNRPSQVYRTMIWYVHSRKEVTTATMSRNFANAGIGQSRTASWAAMISGRWARYSQYAESDRYCIVGLSTGQTRRNRPIKPNVMSQG